MDVATTVQGITSFVRQGNCYWLIAYVYFQFVATNPPPFLPNLRGPPGFEFAYLGMYLDLTIRKFEGKDFDLPPLDRQIAKYARKSNPASLAT